MNRCDLNLLLRVLERCAVSQPEASSLLFADLGVIASTVQRVAVVVVHGSIRNADDYFCYMLGAVELQSDWSSEEVVVG